MDLQNRLTDWVFNGTSTQKGHNLNTSQRMNEHRQFNSECAINYSSDQAELYIQTLTTTILYNYTSNTIELNSFGEYI